MLKSPTMLALLCALFWGMAPIFEKVGLRQLPALPGVLVRSLVVTLAAGLAVAVLAIIHRESVEVFRLNPRSLLWIAAGGIAGGFLAQSFYYAALRTGEASRVTPIASAFPLVTVVLSVLFLGEAVTVSKVLGAGLVVAGVLLLR